MITETELFEQSSNIAWNVLVQAGEPGEPNDAFLTLCHTIGELMKHGERRRLVLSNAAIDAYRTGQVR